MKYTFILISLLLFSFSCTNNESEITKTDLNFNDIKNKVIHLKEEYSFNGESLDLRFIDIEMSGSGYIFGFDQNDGTIVKIENDSIIKKTGGIGRGPNEYDVEAKPSLLICNEKYLIAFELRAARYQVYDLDLNYINTVQLDAIPEEIVCYSQDEIAVFYYMKEGIEIMRFDGNVIRSIKFVETWSGNNLTFKEVIYSKGNFLISYIFDPKLAVYTEGAGIRKLINLPVINPDSVKFATKNISKSGNDIHLYFYDDHSETPKEVRKKGHVFSNKGNYKYTYKVPFKINYYKIISENSLIAVEDTLQKIVVYKFFIDEEPENYP